MRVKIPKELYEAALATFRKTFGYRDEDFRYAKYKDLDLNDLPESEIMELIALCKPLARIRGVRGLVSDCETWLRMLSGSGDDLVKARDCRQFEFLFNRWMVSKPGRRLYEYNAEHPERSLAYYVNDVHHEPEERTSRGGVTPAVTKVTLLYYQFGALCCRKLYIHDKDCAKQSVVEVLGRLNLVTEWPALREGYLAMLNKYNELYDKIGLQLEAVGLASTGKLDGNSDADDEDDRSYAYRRSDYELQLDVAGVPARLVVDVYSESGKSPESDDRAHVSAYYWSQIEEEIRTAQKPKRRKKKDDEDDDEEDANAPNDAGVEDSDEIEIPVHPYLTTFDLRRHKRLVTHVGNVTVHKYRTDLGSSLVIPANVRQLVDMLIAQKSLFKDIVSGKGGGASILCCGPPGVGKTLTAEVYSEASERPLYNVQCSQLGIEPSALESELERCFARAQRWNAILLLDEADVYIRSRGTELKQNAIVGVFLRVLEYYGGVLFMTTNRGDIVDDAIASRCIARITYEKPTEQQQGRIWQILAKSAGLKLSTATIVAVLKEFPNESGRDIKNALKLAAMMPDDGSGEISIESIRFAKTFKPV